MTNEPMASGNLGPELRVSSCEPGAGLTFPPRVKSGLQIELDDISSRLEGLCKYQKQITVGERTARVKELNRIGNRLLEVISKLETPIPQRRLATSILYKYSRGLIPALERAADLEKIHFSLLAFYAHPRAPKRVIDLLRSNFPRDKKYNLPTFHNHLSHLPTSIEGLFDGRSDRQLQFQAMPRVWDAIRTVIGQCKEGERFSEAMQKFISMQARTLIRLVANGQFDEPLRMKAVEILAKHMPWLAEFIPPSYLEHLKEVPSCSWAKIKDGASQAKFLADLDRGIKLHEIMMGDLSNERHGREKARRENFPNISGPTGSYDFRDAAEIRVALAAAEIFAEFRRATDLSWNEAETAAIDTLISGGVKSCFQLALHTNISSERNREGIAIILDNLGWITLELSRSTLYPIVEPTRTRIHSLLNLKNFAQLNRELLIVLNRLNKVKQAPDTV